LGDDVFRNRQRASPRPSPKRQSKTKGGNWRKGPPILYIYVTNEYAFFNEAATDFYDGYKLRLPDSAVFADYAVGISNGCLAPRC
jgi:hypothetical protein